MNQSYEPYRKDSSPLLNNQEKSDEVDDATPAMKPVADDRTLLYFGEGVDVYHPGASATESQRAMMAMEESNLELEKATQENSRWIDMLHSMFGDIAPRGDSTLEGARQESADLLASIQSLVSTPQPVAPAANVTPNSSDPSSAPAPFYAANQQGSPLAAPREASPQGPNVASTDICTHLGNCTCPNCR
eukprot:m.479979 g.479979  ORF g.479979 m.479979 type:complete len:189 (-) comp51376_c0_seq1:39-605(-)